MHDYIATTHLKSNALIHYIMSNIQELYGNKREFILKAKVQLSSSDNPLAQKEIRDQQLRSMIFKSGEKKPKFISVATNKDFIDKKFELFYAIKSPAAIFDTMQRYNEIANVYQTATKYDKALFYYKEVLKLEPQIKNDKILPIIITTYFGIGCNFEYCQQPSYGEALAHYKKALTFLMDLHNEKNHISMIQVLNSIGRIYFKQEQYVQAIAYYKRALKFYEEEWGSSSTSIANLLQDIAVVYEASNHGGKAQLYYYKAYLMYKEQKSYVMALTLLTEYILKYSKRELHECLQKLLDQYNFGCGLSGVVERLIQLDDDLIIADYKMMLSLAFKAYSSDALINGLVYQQLAWCFAQIDQSIIIHEKVLILHDLGCLYHIYGRTTNNEDYIIRAGEIFREGLSYGDNSSVSLLIEYSSYLIACNKKYEAIEYLKKVIEQQRYDEQKSLIYHEIESLIVDEVIQREIKEKKEVVIKANIYAYYLLVKIYINLNQITEAYKLNTQFTEELHKESCVLEGDIYKVLVTEISKLIPSTKKKAEVQDIVVSLGVTPINIDKEKIQSFNVITDASRIFGIRVHNELIAETLKLVSKEEVKKNVQNMVINLEEDTSINIDKEFTGLIALKAVMIYNNILLNMPGLIDQAGVFGGYKLINLLVELGNDAEITEQILRAVEQQGQKAVFNLLLGKVQALSLSTKTPENVVEPQPIVHLQDQLSDNIDLHQIDYELLEEHIVKSDIVNYIANGNYEPTTKISSNAVVSGTGAALMKVIEVKESITYIFTEIIPIFDTSQSNEQASFVSKEGLWTAAHFTGGLALSFVMPGGEAIGTVAKIIAPVSGTSSYVLRHYYHAEFKHNVLAPEIANNCLYNMVLDAGFGALTSLPVAMMTANPMFVAYGVGQAVAMSALSCFGSGNETSGIGYIAGNVAAVFTLYKGLSLTDIPHNFGGAMLAINKIASVLTSITLAHKVVSKLTDQVVNNLYHCWSPVEEDNIADNPVPPVSETTGESSSWWL